MTKEYLKMADVFDDASQEYIGQLLYSGLISKDSCELMAHAVSSHDELVAEVERLREFERDALRYRFLRDNCTTQQADSHGPIFVMTIRQKNNPYNVGLSIDEVMSRSKTNEPVE